MRKQYSIYLEDEHCEWLESESFDQNMSYNDVIRTLIEKEIQS